MYLSTSLILPPSPHGSQQRPFISVVGCNGKTSLLFELAKHVRPVLIGTTTRMLRPDAAVHARLPKMCISLEGVTQTVDLIDGQAPEERSCLQAHDKDGAVQRYIGCDQLFVGTLQANDKIGAPSGERLKHLWDESPYFRAALFEADGSRGLPLKAWEEYEPVIDKRTTHTVALLPHEALEIELSEETVCRYPLFMERYAQFALADTSSPELIAHLINDKQGLFKDAQGLRILLINKIDTLAGVDAYLKELPVNTELGEELKGAPCALTKLIAQVRRVQACTDPEIRLVLASVQRGYYLYV